MKAAGWVIGGLAFVGLTYQVIAAEPALVSTFHDVCVGGLPDFSTVVDNVEKLEGWSADAPLPATGSISSGQGWVRNELTQEMVNTGAASPEGMALAIVLARSTDGSYTCSVQGVIQRTNAVDRLEDLGFDRIDSDTLVNSEGVEVYLYGAGARLSLYVLEE